MLNYLEDIQKKCLKLGADSVEVGYAKSTSQSQTVRMQKPDESDSQESTIIGIKICKNKREAAVTTANFTTATINDLVDRLFAMAQYLPENPYAGPAEPEQLARGPLADLQSFDHTQVTPDELRTRALEMEDIALQQPQITNSSGASFGYGASEYQFLFSNGFHGLIKHSGFSMSVAVLAEHNGEKETDYASATRVFYGDLPPVAEIGLKAAMRARSALGAVQEVGGKFPVVFDKRVAPSISGYVASAINGNSIAKGTSFLCGKLHQNIMHSAITILDDPLVVRGLASQPHDGEGLPVKPTKIIDKGVLTTWLTDLASARQLGIAPTGHAIRGLNGVRPGTTNVILENGSQTPDELIADIKNGFLVMQTMGFGVNMVTGDYSQGASGFWIRDGKISHPVNEMTIAGNLLEMFQHITPANDRELHKTSSAPTLRIEGMTIAGK